MSENTENTQLVLIAGKSATGKSASLRNLRNPEKVAYLNCENNKRLPFPAKFKQANVTDPNQVLTTIKALTGNPEYGPIIVDTLTFMMDMFETQYVLTASNGMKAWGEYEQFFKRLMQDGVAKSDKPIVFMAHTSDVYNENEMVNETMVKVKGSLMTKGVESFFSTVIASKKMPVSKLEPYEKDNKLLNITDEERMLGFKYVYQTKLTKETVNERIRSPLGMWSNQETFIDNDVQLVLDRLQEYYA
ncbi:AAA domain protein [Vibrio phage 12VC501]|nr:AAA domain protein [Vibrio phage 12VC501]